MGRREETVPGTKDHFPTILIVDDHEPNRVLLAEILGEDQYRIVHAKDGNVGHGVGTSQ